jgi:hypothetical protein
MKVRAPVFLAPLGVLLIGGLWQLLGYRLAFHGVQPEYGFYWRSHGPNLERWLFDVPMMFVLVGLALLSVVVCRAWWRQGSRALAVFFFLECFVCACGFAVPAIWFVDVPGRGDIFI